MPRAASCLENIHTLHRATWLQLAIAGASVEMCMAIKGCNRRTAARHLQNAKVVLNVPLRERLRWHLKKTVAEEVQVPLRHVKDASNCPEGLTTGAGLETLLTSAVQYLPTVEYYAVGEALDYSKAA